MHLIEMKALADQNCKTYVSEFGTYSKANGFSLKEKFFNDTYLLDSNLSTYVNDLFKKDCWHLQPAKKMTKTEIEKVLGYEVDIVDEPLTHNAKQEKVNEKNRDRELSGLEKILFDIINDSLRKENRFGRY